MYQYFLFFLSVIFALGILVMVVSVGSVLLLGLVIAVGLFLLYLRIRFWLYKRQMASSYSTNEYHSRSDDGVIETEYEVVDDDTNSNHNK